MEVCCFYVNSISKKYSSLRNAPCLSAYLLCGSVWHNVFVRRERIHLHRDSQIDSSLANLQSSIFNERRRKGKKGGRFYETESVSLVPY